MVAAGLVVGGGAVVAAPLVLSAAGFTAGGVAAGSAAAFVQSMIGNVAAGSWFALCQSAGAAGIATSSSAVIGTVGTAVGTAAAGVSSLFKGEKVRQVTYFYLLQEISSELYVVCISMGMAIVNTSVFFTGNILKLDFSLNFSRFFGQI